MSIKNLSVVVVKSCHCCLGLPSYLQDILFCVSSPPRPCWRKMQLKDKSVLLHVRTEAAGKIYRSWMASFSPVEKRRRASAHEWKIRPWERSLICQFGTWQKSPRMSMAHKSIGPIAIIRRTKGALRRFRCSACLLGWLLSTHTYTCIHPSKVAQIRSKWTAAVGRIRVAVLSLALLESPVYCSLEEWGEFLFKPTVNAVQTSQAEACIMNECQAAH